MSKTTDTVSNTANQIQLQAIYEGLISVFPEEEAKIALEKWTAYFSNTNSVFKGLNNFAKEVCISFDKNDQQRDLVRALNRALIFKGNSVSSKENTSDTSNQSLASSTSDTQHIAELNHSEVVESFVNQQISTPEFQTFQVFFLYIIDLVEKKHVHAGTPLRHFLRELIENMPWSEAQQEQLLTLLDTGSTNQVRKYKPDQLKSFIAHVHAWMADEVGASDAIRILSQAVKATEKMTVGIEYSPKNFV